MKKFQITCYYANLKDRDDVKTTKKTVSAKDETEARLNFTPKQQPGYEVLNWVATAVK